MGKGKLKYAVLQMCPECGAEFLRTGSRQRFCSPDCRVAQNRREFNKAKRKNRECLYCGRELEGTHKHKFCSEDCRIKYAAGNYEYIKNPKIKPIERVDWSRVACTRMGECIYAVKAGGLDICDYIGIEGHSRGCYADGDECPYFKPKKADRRLSPSVWR